jgi:hypothetical protein
VSSAVVLDGAAKAHQELGHDLDIGDVWDIQESVLARGEE